MVPEFLWSRWRPVLVWPGFLGCLTGSLLVLGRPASTLAQPPAPKSRPAAAAPRGTAHPKATAPTTRPRAEDAPAPAPDVAEVPPDPSRTRKVAPTEVFKDPHAEALLEVTKFPEVRGPLITPAEIAQVKGMAANPNETPDRTLIEKMIQGLAAQLTDHRNIQALINPPPNMKPDAPVAHAIQDATSNLLEPLFLAQAQNNQAFLTIYHRALIRWLDPLVKTNHLIPRIQAMIVLGECGSPEALSTYENEIKSARQTLWVKLWALEGIANIKRKGGRLLPDVESKAAKTISDFLDKDTEGEMPWPVKVRALEALGALRQGFLPAQPKYAHMASTAMRFLADPEARLEVRSEAARTLGLMQITTAVPRYNFALVAHAAGELAADLGTAIDSTFSAKPPRADNPTKARYLVALLIGPVYETFQGSPQARDSGLLHVFVNPANAYVQKVFDLIKPIAQTSVVLLNTPGRAIPDLKKQLESQIAALRSFLEKNPPPNRQLVQGGRDFPAAASTGAWLNAPARPVAGVDRGR
jgi:hypothetical protein